MLLRLEKINQYFPIEIIVIYSVWFTVKQLLIVTTTVNMMTKDLNQYSLLPFQPGSFFTKGTVLLCYLNNQRTNLKMLHMNFLQVHCIYINYSHELQFSYSYVTTTNVWKVNIAISNCNRVHPLFIRSISRMGNARHIHEED